MRRLGVAVAVTIVLLAGITGGALAQTGSPEPSAAAEVMTPEAAELVALFPEAAGGQPIRENLEVQVGDEHIAGMDPDDPDDASEMQSLEAVAQAMGGTTADIVSASAFVEAEDGSYGLVGAYRVPGGDASLGVDPILAWGEGDLSEPRVETGTYANREVTLLYDDSQPENPPWHIYPAGDTLWLVMAEEPLLTEIFEQLP